MIKCEICGREFSAINKRHLASHLITKEEYLNRFPNAELQSVDSQKKRQEAAAKRNASKTAAERSEIGKRAAAKRIENGFTSWNDGKGGYTLEWSEDAKLRVKERGAWNKGIACSNDQKQKQSQVMKQKFANGEMTHWNTGKFHSDETKEKIRNTCMKYRLTYDQKQKMEMNKAKYRQSENYKPPMSGKKHSYEAKLKMRQSYNYNKLRAKFEQLGIWIPVEQLPEFIKYKREVWKITNQNLHKIPNYDASKRGRCSLTKDTYQVDHNYSIYEGFIEDISAEIIGHHCNLSFIPWRENLQKWNKSSISLDDLLDKINNLGK